LQFLGVVAAAPAAFDGRRSVGREADNTDANRRREGAEPQLTVLTQFGPRSIGIRLIRLQGLEQHEGAARLQMADEGSQFVVRLRKGRNHTKRRPRPPHGAIYGIGAVLMARRLGHANP